jgi:hypothetical protein
LCTSKGKIFLVTRSLWPLYGALKGMLWKFWPELHFNSSLLNTRVSEDRICSVQVTSTLCCHLLTSQMCCLFWY